MSRKVDIPYVFGARLDGTNNDREWKYLAGTRRRHAALDDLREYPNVFTNELIYRLVENRIKNYDLPPSN